VADVGRSLAATTLSSRFTAPIYWRDARSGIAYQVQVQVAQTGIAAAKELGTIPVKRNGSGVVLVQDVARIREGKMPGEYDRYNMRRLVSLTANIEGEDLGRVSRQLSQSIVQVGELPAGVGVDLSG